MRRAASALIFITPASVSHRDAMTFLPRISMRALRPVVAIVLIFAQGMAAFGFPVLQTRHIVKACGCVTPCGAETENCCCAKVALTPEPKRARCSKCVDRDDSIPPAEPQVKWVAGFKAKQSTGGIIHQKHLLFEVGGDNAFAHAFKDGREFGFIFGGLGEQGADGIGHGI